MYMYITHVCFKSNGILGKFPSLCLTIYIRRAYALIFHTISASVKLWMPQHINAELHKCDCQSVIAMSPQYMVWDKVRRTKKWDRGWVAWVAIKRWRQGPHWAWQGAHWQLGYPAAVLTPGQHQSSYKPFPKSRATQRRSRGWGRQWNTTDSILRVWSSQGGR